MAKSRFVAPRNIRIASLNNGKAAVIDLVPSRYSVVAAEQFEPKKSILSLAPPLVPERQQQPAAPLTRTRTVLMAGNWKMNPTSIKEARELSALVASAARTLAQDKPGFNVEVTVIPPSPFLSIVADQINGTFAKLGAQDLHPAAKGAFTGGISPGMLSSLGCSYVLAGHSERRVIFKEDDALINKKVLAILEGGMSPILCIGESKQEYEAGQARQVCLTQLAGGLKDVSPKDMSKVVIAYEPVWAIGTGLTATPAIAQSIHAFIRGSLAEMYSQEVADAVRIQYGGSVTPETVDELMTCPDIDGCLIGGASLAADKFSRIFAFKAHAGPRKLYATEVVASGCTLGESTVWSSRLQRLFWVDSVGQALWSWDGADAVKWSFPEVVGCVALKEGRDLLLGLASGLYNFDPATGSVDKICDFEPGLDTRPNDGRVDRNGSFVIGSYNNAHRQDGKEIGGLWRLDPMDGSLVEIMDGKFRCSNCISFSPDGRTLYFCDTPTRRIFAYDYSPNGKLGKKRLLYEQPSHLAGGPDGAQTDGEGFLWACLSGASQVVRLSPIDGSVDMVVELPVSSPTCCTIGGPELDTLYISTRKPDGGGLYSVKLPSGIKGNVEPEFGARGRRGGGTQVVSQVVNMGSNSNHEVSHSTASAPGWLRWGWGSSGSQNGGLHGTAAEAQQAQGAAKSVYCTSCGTPHANATARFCSQCGEPRS